MHSLVDCPLRTFCTITTTDSYPFSILGLDQDALDLFIPSSSCALDPPSPSSLKDCASLSQRRTRLDHFLRGKSILDFLLPDHDSLFLSSSSFPSPSTPFSLPSLPPLPPSTIELQSATAAAAGSESTCPEEHFSTVIQPFLVSPPSDDTVSGSTRAFPTSSRYPIPQKQHRRVHGCIHRSVVCSAPADRRVPGSSETEQSCRVYVLKDVARIHDLAVAARTDLSSQQRSSPAPSLSPSSSSSSLSSSASSRKAARPKGALVIGHPCQPKLYPTPICSSPVVSPSPQQQTKQQQHHHRHQQQRPLVAPPSHRVDHHYDNSRTSTSNKQDTRALSPSGTAAVHPPHQNQNCSSSKSLLLMLQVTRFGTIDHAFAVLPASSFAPSSAYPSLFLGQDQAAMEALTNCSIMSCVHPQDLRPLCQGLDRVCKALYTQFRVRWRVARMAQPLDDRVVSADMTSGSRSNNSSNSLPSQRKIEFQGEFFEEWIDPTGMESCDQILPEPQQSEEFAWIEIKGVLSEGQPMLVLRPLITQELTLLQEEKKASMSATMSLPELHQVLDVDDTHDGATEEEDSCASAQELWKSKSRRMGQEEGLMLPRQLNLSALTTLSLEERSSRMPGSLPPSVVNSHNGNSSGSGHAYSQMSISSSSRCYSTGSHHGRTSGRWITMPAGMAFSPPSSPPWTIVMTVALDAWRDWIQTVHAGQAQFQDWCEYVLVLTLDQVIESVSLGLTLLGIEGSQSLVTSTSNTNTTSATSRAQLTEMSDEVSESESESEDVEVETLEQQDLIRQATPRQPHQEYRYTPENQTHGQGQQSLSGLDRVGKILEGYPSIDGYVKQIGGSWLGKMVKNRLEHKLERVAGQVVTWWDMSSALSSSLSSSTFTGAGISNNVYHGSGSLGNVGAAEERIVQ